MTLFFGSLWILVNGLADTLPLLSAACLHEAGHLLMCLLLRVPVLLRDKAFFLGEDV